MYFGHHRAEQHLWAFQSNRCADVAQIQFSIFGVAAGLRNTGRDGLAVGWQEPSTTSHYGCLQTVAREISVSFTGLQTQLTGLPVTSLPKDKV